MHVQTEKDIGKLGQQFSNNSTQCRLGEGDALPTYNNENSIQHLEESVGQWEAEYLDQLPGSER